MLKLTYPNIQCTNPFETCLLSVNSKHSDYITRMTNISSSVASAWVDFDTLSASKDLHLLVPCQPKRIKQIISGNVKKSELKALYEIHMLKKGSDSRKIYDKLRACARGKCPLCGIRDVATLDHYLPKARYPLHSVNPRNLVPACRDCNTGKLDKIFTHKNEQTLYPYDEDDKFYTDEWIYATIERVRGLLVFDFFVDPPTTWPQIDRERAINHFNAFNLNKAYTLNASLMVSTIQTTITFLRNRGGDSEEIKDWCQEIIDNDENPSVKAIFRAIKLDEHMCNGLF